MYVCFDSWLWDWSEICTVAHSNEVRRAHWFDVKMSVISVTRFLMYHSIHVAEHVTVLACWNVAAWTSVTVWGFALVSFGTKWCSCPCAGVKAWRTAPRMLNLSIRWMWVVSFTLRPFWSRWQHYCYLLHTRMRGLWTFRRVMNFFSLPATETSISGSSR